MFLWKPLVSMRMLAAQCIAEVQVGLLPGNFKDLEWEQKNKASTAEHHPSNSGKAAGSFWSRPRCYKLVSMLLRLYLLPDPESMCTTMVEVMHVHQCLLSE